MIQGLPAHADQGVGVRHRHCSDGQRAHQTHHVYRSAVPDTAVHPLRQRAEQHDRQQQDAAAQRLAHHAEDLTAAGVQYVLDALVQAGVHRAVRARKVISRRVLQAIQVQCLRLGGEHVAGPGRAKAGQQKQRRRCGQNPFFHWYLLF